MADTTTSNIITLVRLILGDTIKSGVDIETYTTSSIFTLSEPNTQAVSSVAINDESSGVTYTYDSSLQKVTVSSSLSVDDIVEFDYTYYSNYSDTELTNYIKNALMYISINKYCDFQIVEDIIYPAPSLGEENLIATIAGIIIEPNNQSYKTSDFSVTVRNTMPTNDMIAKVIAVFKKSIGGVSAII